MVRTQRPLDQHWSSTVDSIIDRKPESGCEIQNSACRESGLIFRLKVVKHIESEDLHTMEGPDKLPHGIQVNETNWYYHVHRQIIEVFMLILILHW